MKPFNADEYADRLLRVRQAMSEHGLDGIIITNPENIYYLTGLNHQGYFAYTSLIVPLESEPGLITRAMEQAIVRDTVSGVRHFPYSDGVAPLPQPEQPLESSSAAAAIDPSPMSIGISVTETVPSAPDFDAPVDATCDALRQVGLTTGRVAFERSSTYLPYRIADGFVRRMPHISWADADGLVADCRSIQSPAELACTRQAAAISDAMIMAGTAMAGPGIREQDVMASIYQVMFQRGGTYPAFVPLVRSGRAISHEHGTWDQVGLRRRDLLFMEMAGCRYRYHAPIGRLTYIGGVSRESARIYQVALDALYAAADALRPGTTAGAVYDAWQAVVDRAGLHHYGRHHCGYMVGIGFPPSWSGSGVPRGLRRGSDLVIRPGMVFHLMSWLLRTGRGDAFFSDTVTVTEDGCEFLTRAPRDLIVR
ncbi:M24 family metallopeptidase [Cumulibacter soli]|uniref:M24 family metallopeptidase n=1 Tax=Cumulibacter soli TaxID=2546344 RepID=UPI0010683E6E|nr:Xaa-Pro peptidase family protein [Cumulibacter soli]